MYKMPNNSPAAARATPTKYLAVTSSQTDALSEVSYKKYLARKLSDETKQRLNAQTNTPKQSEKSRNLGGSSTPAAVTHAASSASLISQSAPIDITHRHAFFSMSQDAINHSSRSATPLTDSSTDEAQSSSLKQAAADDDDIFAFEL